MNGYPSFYPRIALVAPSLGHSFADYTPRFNEVERGVYWYHLVRLSVCPSVDRIVSALYLQEILANFLKVELWLDPIWLNGMGNHEAAGSILRTQAF